MNAITGTQVSRHYWWLVAIRGLLVLFGVLLAVLPGVRLLRLVWLVGINALAFGIILVIRAFQFRTAGIAYM